tara:strand:- start:723 stop:1709 length:987 start_codon:yes stop_codon:yes gene_type:complete
MTNKCTILTYHYVRDLVNSSFPNIKGLDTEEFIGQLNYLERFYRFINVEDLITSLYDGKHLPKNSVFLTFDDGYIDHYDTVFPILKSKGIQGCFFPPAEAILESEVLDVNKIHFILASTNANQILKELYKLLDKYRVDYKLETNDYYFSHFAKKGKYDMKEVVFIKKLLQRELELEVRTKIIDRLFYKFVSKDVKSFSKEIYVTTGNLTRMIEEGMHVGSHGYSHKWLDSLSLSEQEYEIDKSLSFLRNLGVDMENWVISYPYGGFNNETISVIESRDCKLAFTTQVDFTNLALKNRFMLERFDTNDFPKNAFSDPNSLTEKIKDTKL